jgi:hypothetical protein
MTCFCYYDPASEIRGKVLSLIQLLLNCSVDLDIRSLAAGWVGTGGNNRPLGNDNPDNYGLLPGSPLSRVPAFSLSGLGQYRRRARSGFGPS